MHKIGLNKAANQEEGNLRMYQPFIKIFHYRHKEVNVLNFGCPSFR